jgi:CO/xanthine dehydrogenase FAD-binding subunit
MKPAPFQYFRPATVEEALELLERHDPEAKVLAGGQSLVPLMNFRLAAPACLVDANGIPGLSHIRRTDGVLAIGAMTRQSDIEDSPVVAESCPLLLEATRLIGHRSIRNRGTIGGSIAHADPSAEYPATLLALDGEVEVLGPGGARTIRAQDLFVTICTTSIAPTELLTEVRVPVLPAGTGSAFVELNRRHGDYAIVGVATVVTLDGRDRCADVRVAAAGVGPTPLRLEAAEELLRGERLEDGLLEAAAARCADAVEPGDDLHATAAYKRAMVTVFVQRALRLARERCGRVDGI